MTFINEIEYMLIRLSAKETAINNKNRSDVLNLQTKVERKKQLASQLHHIKDKVSQMISQFEKDSEEC